ncbi:hypothetical protein BgiBS90_021676 [Biomphalaria glabrata]|nr:hypothetical protein BgiBS90_021676 [Biomphalaria glabrata]
MKDLAIRIFGNRIQVSKTGSLQRKTSSHKRASSKSPLGNRNSLVLRIVPSTVRKDLHRYRPEAPHLKFCRIKSDVNLGLIPGSLQGNVVRTKASIKLTAASAFINHFHRSE